MVHKNKQTDSAKTGTRIAMWSGPRNISTALMRSWGSRDDCAVVDEPLYAHYLSVIERVVRESHPGWRDVLEAQPREWQTVADELTGPIPGGKAIWYQKHMAHHVTRDMSRDWLLRLSHCFLIRDPGEMMTSFIKVIPEPRPEDLGLPQQVALFDWLRTETGMRSPVIDAHDVLTNPRGVLRALCEKLGVPFTEAMLQWKPGPRPEDGVWAPHWYANVERSTGFGAYEPKNEPVPAHLRGVHEECQALYDVLAEHRITAH